MDFVYPYLDDFLVSPPDPLTHKIHLKQLFGKMSEYGILINTSKCVFGASEVSFLGYRISADGIKPLDEKIQAVKDFPKPVTIKQLRRFHF